MANDAREQERRKRELEAVVSVEVQRWLDSVIRDTRSSYPTQGTLPLDYGIDTVYSILENHYRRVWQAFEGESGIELQPDVDEEMAAENIATSLELFVLDRASRSANQITTTNRNQALRAEQEAVADFVQREGRQPSRIETALLVAAILAVRYRNRAKNIATFETQQTAEARKLTEAQANSGEEPYLIALGVTGVVATSRVSKTWIDIGDDRVRPDHRAASGQTVPTNEPFQVGGELLMFPGDISLGATPAQTANCRCASIFMI